jgi:hypothetical protein
MQKHETIEIVVHNQYKPSSHSLSPLVEALLAARRLAF